MPRTNQYGLDLLVESADRFAYSLAEIFKCAPERIRCGYGEYDEGVFVSVEFLPIDDHHYGLRCRVQVRDEEIKAVLPEASYDSNRVADAVYSCLNDRLGMALAETLKVRQAAGYNEVAIGNGQYEQGDNN